MHIKIDQVKPRAITYLPNTFSPYTLAEPEEGISNWTLQAFWYSNDRTVLGACFGFLFLDFDSSHNPTYETFLESSGSEQFPGLNWQRQSIHRFRNGKANKRSSSEIENLNANFSMSLPEYDQVDWSLKEMLENPLPQLPEADGWYLRTTHK